MRRYGDAGDAIARLRARDLVAAGPRGAPQTFVTTDTFLAAFGMDTLDDLPDLERWRMPGERA